MDLESSRSGHFFALRLLGESLNYAAGTKHDFYYLTNEGTVNIS
jgi:hypothetical protein